MELKPYLSNVCSFTDRRRPIFYWQETIEYNFYHKLDPQKGRELFSSFTGQRSFLGLKQVLKILPTGDVL